MACSSTGEPSWLNGGPGNLDNALVAEPGCRPVRKYRTPGLGVPGLSYNFEEGLVPGGHMNRNDFVAEDGEPWWLWETQIDSQTDEARRQVGMALGFSENEWYADPNRRTTLYDLLESKAQPAQRSGQPERRRGQAAMGTERDDPGPSARPHPGGHDQPGPAGPGVAERPRPPRRRHDPAGQEVDLQGQAGSGVGRGGGPAGPAAAAPAAPRLPRRPRSRSSRPRRPTGADRGPQWRQGRTAAAPGLDQAVQTVLADVTGGGLAGLASDLGVEAEELEEIVNHPDFERDVREALARITAG